MRQLKINHFLEQRAVLVSRQRNDEHKPGSHTTGGV